MSFSPRFPVTNYDELRYFTGYEVSGALVDVRYILTDEGMRYDVYSPSKKIHAHILLPKGRKCSQLLVDSVPASFTFTTVGDSRYVDFTLENITGGKVSLQILTAEG